MNYGYYFVVCIRDTGKKRKVLAAGCQREDLDRCARYGYDPAEEAMTDFWDGTGIPYSSSWRDDMWDELERYVFEIDEHTYWNASTLLPQTDKEIFDYMGNAHLVLEENKMKGNKEMKLVDEVKQYEGLWEEESEQAPINETVRSSAEIKAEIARLEQELKAAEIAEKKASYNGNTPQTVWVWDMYLESSDKGSWTSAENENGKWEGIVFETEDEALDAGWNLLNELADEDELYDDDDEPCDPDDYYVEAFEVPLSEVDITTLEESDLQHLI